MFFSRKKTAHRKKLGLYIHIPFCRSKCAYCDFYSLRMEDPQKAETYVDALISHMKSYRTVCEEYEPDTVFLGGGTPTVLPEKQLYRLVWAIRRNFHLSKKCEFTVEANPATVTLRMLRILRWLGVNRLSMGLQSAHPEELKVLSRIHTREEFENSWNLARKARFSNINVDLMFGIPGQTKESLLRSLSYVTKLGPEHISLYDLRVEPNTPFGKLQAEGKLRLPDEDEETDMYLTAVRFLASRGYEQYEISNFAKRGYACRHNLKYWNCEEYLGFGTAAHSYFGGNRFSVVSHLDRYIAGVLPMTSGVSILASNEPIPERQRIGEYVMLRLRLRRGIDSQEFFRRFGVSFDKMYGWKLEKFIPGGFVIHEKGRYALTPRGFFVSNYILSDILELEDLKSTTFI